MHKGEGTVHSYNTNEWAVYDTTSGRKEGREDGPRGKETGVPSGAFVFHDRLFQEWLMHTVPKAAPATRGEGRVKGERGVVKLYDRL